MISGEVVLCCNFILAHLLTYLIYTGASQAFSIATSVFSLSLALTKFTQLLQSVDANNHEEEPSRLANGVLFLAHLTEIGSKTSMSLFVLVLSIMFFWHSCSCFCHQSLCLRVRLDRLASDSSSHRHRTALSVPSQVRATLQAAGALQQRQEVPGERAFVLRASRFHRFHVCLPAQRQQIPPNPLPCGKILILISRTSEVSKNSFLSCASSKTCS